MLDIFSEVVAALIKVAMLGHHVDAGALVDGVVIGVDLQEVFKED